MLSISAHPFESIKGIFNCRWKHMFRSKSIVDIHYNSPKLCKQRTEPSLRVQVPNCESSSVEDDEPWSSLRWATSGLVDAAANAAVVSHRDADVLLGVRESGWVDFWSCIFRGFQHSTNLKDIGVCAPRY